MCASSDAKVLHNFAVCCSVFVKCENVSSWLIPQTPYNESQFGWNVTPLVKVTLLNPS